MQILVRDRHVLFTESVVNDDLESLYTTSIPIALSLCHTLYV